jgi:HD-like signal output (HDOD) protein
VLGCSHADIGSGLAAAWGLPSPIVMAIADHHRTGFSDAVVTAVVQVANIVARTIGEGVGNEGMRVAVDGGAAARLNLTHERFERICADTTARLREVLALHGAE